MFFTYFIGTLNNKWSVGAINMDPEEVLVHVFILHFRLVTFKISERWNCLSHTISMKNNFGRDIIALIKPCVLYFGCHCCFCGCKKEQHYLTSAIYRWIVWPCCIRSSMTDFYRLLFVFSIYIVCLLLNKEVCGGTFFYFSCVLIVRKESNCCVVPKEFILFFISFCEWVAYCLCLFLSLSIIAENKTKLQ